MRAAAAYSPYPHPIESTSSPATMAPIPDPVSPEP
jgi:hypothetical protein